MLLLFFAAVLNLISYGYAVSAESGQEVHRMMMRPSLPGVSRPHLLSDQVDMIQI
jgi:hypothetical protein